jgi:acetyl coenzyme A synthetase (ADP forming)-like protein
VPAVSEYPAHWVTDAVLSDGGTTHIRPITADDGDRLVDFHSRLSPETTYYRFFSPHPELTPHEVERFTHVDHHDRVALVAELVGRIVAVGRYDRIGDTTAAEVAFVVADEHQGRGLGTLLLEQLAAAARERGINRFLADTLPDNRRMIQVFRDAGFEVSQRFEEGAVRVELGIEPTERARAVIQNREHRAAARSMARVLDARSVAVIGAGRRPLNVGHQVVTNLLGGFDGVVYPVNPSATGIAGVKAYPTLTDIPDPIDLAVIAVPAASVLGVVQECAAAGVKGLVVLTAGFGELGDAGATVEVALRDLARGSGMRLIGPNCVGIVNTATGLNATFASWSPAPGSVAMQSQSGALGIALLERSQRSGIGVSSFVSVGNKADVSGNDLLEYWEDDPATKVILLYLESFGNPRRFARIARRVSRRKPIVAVKSGRTEAGARAASSHTAALASTDAAVEALFRQTGVIRVDTVDDLFETARVLDRQPLPAGRRVAIVTNSGGPGVLATDACAGAGLDLAALDDATRSVIRDAAGPNAAVVNPVDLVASATPALFETAIRATLADDNVDAVVVISTPTFAAPPLETAEAIGRAAASSEIDKPVVASFLAWPEMPPVLPDDVPAFAAPEPAVRALGRAADYADWRRRDPGTVPDLHGIGVDEGQALIARALGDGEDGRGRWLTPDEVDQLLGAYQIPLVPTHAAATADDAVAAADKVGYPVVLKATGPTILHKSDVGGVRLDLSEPGDVRAAFDDMRSRLGDDLAGVIVQHQVEEGVELIVGVTHDPMFGPLVMAGLGGVAVELLGDRGFRVVPVTDHDAAELVRSLRGSPLLFGYRGRPPADVAALERVILKIAQLAADLPEVAEVDLNPVIVSDTGATVVDARVRVAPLARPPGLDARHMGEA